MNFVLIFDFDPGDAVSPKFIFVFNYLTAPPPRQLQATRNSSYMFWRLFGWSAKICDFQPEWHFVFLFVLKDLKREISRFVENGFPIFRSSCWPDLAQGSVCKQVCVVCSVQTSQVGSKIPNKWQQFASPVTKSPSAILPSGNSEVQKVIFALSNFENVSKTLPKIGFWCVV